jgi:hypothetical protein
LPEKIRKKISEARKGKKLSDETKRKISLSMIKYREENELL